MSGKIPLGSSLALKWKKTGKIGVNLSMPSSSKSRLTQLWKRRMNLEVEVNLMIKSRLGRFREGTLSSEDFEKATEPERNLERVNGQIAKIEKRL